ncbi:MAG: hypothetical protein NXI32_09065 [bacterium]|nr:hypothetical protein [bacterium]
MNNMSESTTSNAAADQGFNPKLADVALGSTTPIGNDSFSMGLVIIDILHMVLLALFLNAMFLPDLQVPNFIRWLAIAGLLLSITRGYGWLILLVSQAYFLVSEPGHAIFSPEMDDVRFCFATLMLIAYSFRFQAVRSAMHAWLSQRWPDLFAVESGASAAQRLESKMGRWQRLGNPQASTATTARSLGSGAPLIRLRDGLLSWVAVSCTSLLLAIFIVSLLPYSEFVSDRMLFRSVREGKTLLPGATVCALTVGLLVLVREMAWRQHTVAQAELYLRSVFTMEHFHDLQMIVRRQFKMMRKRRREPPAARVER